MEINKTNIKNEDIDEVKIRFTVNKSWIDDNNINESLITLNRYNKSWQKLPTQEISEDNEFVYYESESPGLSVFAISGEEIIEAPVEEIPEEEQQLPYWIVGIIGVLAVIGLFYWKNGIGQYWKKKGKVRKRK